MKKQLLVGAFMLASFLTAQAQQLTYTFDDLTVGNLGTAFDGSAAGQGGWATVANNGTAPTTTTNASNSIFQVVASGDTGNGLQIEGPNGDKGFFFAAQPGTQQFWLDRTNGNNVLEVSYRFYTGTPSASINTMDSYATDDSEDSKILAGISFNTKTLEVNGLAYFTGGSGTGTYIFSLGTQENPDVILPANTWVTVGYKYNFTTGEVTFIAPDVNASIPGAAASSNIGLVLFGADSGSSQAATNTASSTGKFDTISVKATGTAGVEDNLISSLSVYPNPANDVVNVTNAENILVNGITVTDLNGRTVKTAKFEGVANAQINVSDLASGIYMMTVSSDKGSMTKKIVKN